MTVPIARVLYPIQDGIHAAITGIEDLWRGYVFLVGAREENEHLRAESGRLQRENMRLTEEAALLPRLQFLLDYQGSAPMTLRVAEVVGRTPTHWHQTVLINQGEADGVKTHMGVMTPEGAVGVVIKTLSHYAQILLMTDRRAAVAATVRRTRDQGIVEGSGAGPSGGVVRVKYLPLSSEVAVGDVLVTSGLEGSFSEGIPIGTVTRVTRKAGEMFLDVEAMPSVSFSKLEAVFVVTATGRDALPSIEAPAP